MNQTVNRATAIALLLLLVSACSTGQETPPNPTGAATTAHGTAAGASATAETMAAALRQLVAKDHTFGEGPPPFIDYLILTSLDPAAGTGFATQPMRPLTRSERGAIEEAISNFGPVTWIDDRDDFISDDLTPTIEGAAIIGVGEPSIDGDTALVPVSLWCGGTCGTWLTYRLDLRSGSWIVTGTEGPRAIS